MEPPVDESRVGPEDPNGPLLTTQQAYSEHLDPDEPPNPMSLSQSILLASTSSVRVKELGTSRAQHRQWTWGQYLCWVIPTLWATMLYLIQLGYGSIEINQQQQLATYNMVAGFLGLTVTALRISDVWIYVKPVGWLTLEDVRELEGITQRSWVREWGMFTVIFVLDMVLFIWTTVGSVYTFVLYGSDLVYPEVLLVFAIINLVWHWSKFGLLMMSVKMLLSWRGAQLIRVAGRLVV